MRPAAGIPWPPPLQTIFARRLISNRPCYEGINIGFAVGGTVLVPLLALGVNHLGWRTTAMLVGIVLWALVPLTYSVLRRSAPEVESTIDGTKASPRPATRTTRFSGRPRTITRGPGAALVNRSFWFLSISYGLRGMAWAALSVHLVPIMVWKGIEEASAGLLAGAYPLLWIPAQLLVVRLAHRWSKPHLAAVAALISSTGYVLLAAFTHVEAWQILLVFALLAANETSWPLAWSMLAEQFGLRNFGVLKGIFMAVVSFMGLGAPAYAGWVFDRTVSYSWVVGPAAFLLILAGILTWLAFPGAGEHLEARRKPAS